MQGRRRRGRGWTERSSRKLARTAPAAGRLALLLLSVLGVGCEAWTLARYALVPDAPRYRDGDAVSLAGLSAPVEVARRRDGLWRIEARSEPDALRVAGYLMGRDRLAQLDLLRHLARGELAAYVGDRPFGDRRALDVDRQNRFLGFRERAARLLDGTSPQERGNLGAFVAGVNAWIDEGRPSLEHRLLGVDRPRPWRSEDSLAIYAMIMNGLSGNADREIRRLLLACAAGVERLERLWPADFEFGAPALPPGGFPDPVRPPPPGVVPEMRKALPGLCPAPEDGASPGQIRGAGPPAAGPLGRFAALVTEGWSASNNWALAPALTASGRALLSSDPHLPHMNPPLAWGVEMAWPGVRVAGFTLPGLHRVVFGHNGRVAWGATTNHVDRQDLVVHRLRRQRQGKGWREGIEIDGAFVPYELREERFEVRGGRAVRMQVRFTPDGPLWNDLDPRFAGRLPPTALRSVDAGGGADLDGAAGLNRAASVEEAVAALSRLDLGCSSWLLADADGHIAFRSPCRVPVRRGWRGTFPVPGWTGRHRWAGTVDKSRLPAVDDPVRGWLATANSVLVPAERLAVPYHNDASAPDRFLRIADRLAAWARQGGVSVEQAEALQLDRRIHGWPRLRRALLGEACAGDAGASDALARARLLLCRWDGEMAPESPAATLYTLWTHALLDEALADALPPGARAEIWPYVQRLPQFEANVQWLWGRPEDHPVWDDERSAARETRAEILDRALARALSEGEERLGPFPEAWQWGAVRPFTLRHPFAASGGLLGWLLNGRPLALGGGNETVFKHQFPRSDRTEMRVEVGPVLRFTVDFARPWEARYGLAGGESGWPRSRHYGDGLADWAAGRGRPLTPPPSEDDVRVRFAPPARS